MKTIHVQASKSYDVIIGNNLLNQLGKHLFSVLNRTCKIAVISDSNVYPLYGDIAKNSLINNGFETVNYVFPAGEASKNPTTYISILNFLAENHITRTDVIVALGGGVTGDMSGFAASTYLRGIPYIQVPTTLLAMVDSSVGGKTAIDLPAGKNLVGAFYQPSLVLCDLDTLKTLPDMVFCDGCAEVIKYGVLFDVDLFNHLAAHGLNFDREEVIGRCIEWKRNVVANDEFDTGARAKLNLGHTIGHGVEALSNFTITHGQAVAIGMSIIAKAGCKAIYKRLTEVIETFHLPTSTTFTANQLYLCALSDKKRAGGTINLIIPNSIGNCSIVPIDVDHLESFIKEGL